VRDRELVTIWTTYSKPPTSYSLLWILLPDDLTVIKLLCPILGYTAFVVFCALGYSTAFLYDIIEVCTGHFRIFTAEITEARWSLDVNALSTVSCTHAI